LRANPRERGAQGTHLVIPFYICVCVCVCVCVCDCGSHLTLHLCPTFIGPINCSPSDSSVHRISQARLLEWVAISSSKGSSQPRDQTHISSIGRWILYHCTSWEAHPSDQIYVVVVQPSSRVQLCVTPWTAAGWVSLSLTISRICPSRSKIPPKEIYTSKIQ